MAISETIQTPELISVINGPKFTILWGRVDKVLLFNWFFSLVDTCLYLQRYGPTKLCDGAHVANFWRYFASCISSKPLAARFRPES